jgi:hypothetical protein
MAGPEFWLVAGPNGAGKKYPEHEPRKVLLDLIGSSPAKGKWFAAAKEAGVLDVALECAAADGADPATLTRAARDFAQSNPDFALQVAVHAIAHFLAAVVTSRACWT